MVAKLSDWMVGEFADGHLCSWGLESLKKVHCAVGNIILRETANHLCIIILLTRKTINWELNYFNPQFINQQSQLFWT